MQLRHINIRALIAEAGGDPWAIEHSLHAGRPAQIAELAEAFHAAGRCTAEANAAFEEARRRFDIPGLGSVEIDIPGTPASIDPEWSRPPGSITDDHVFDAPLHR